MKKWVLLALASAVAVPANAATVYSNNFDGGLTAASGVTATLTGGTTSTALAGPWNAAGWAGTFHLNDATGNPAAASVLTLTGLVAGSAVKVNGIIGLLQSWDSTDAGGSYSPDILSFEVNGSLVATMTSNQASGSILDLAGATPIALYQQVDANTGYSDVLGDLSTASIGGFADGSGMFVLRIFAGGSGWQGSSDENWGIDSLSVDGTSAGAVPEPASWAMMIGGLGLAGGFMRRRKATVRVA